jgi:hypothetical protein
MKTQRIKLSELRQIVKQVIREERSLNEALNKDMRLFGKDLAKYLTKQQFQVRLISGKIPDEDYTKISTNMGLVALELLENPAYQMLTLYYNPKEVTKIEKVVKKFQLSPYAGKEFSVDGGWAMKQVVGALNPGDIYHYGKEKGKYYFIRTKDVDTKTIKQDIK